MIRKLFVLSFILLNDSVVSLNFKHFYSDFKDDFNSLSKEIRDITDDFDVMEKTDFVGKEIEGKSRGKQRGKQGKSDEIVFRIEEQGVLKRRIFVKHGRMFSKNKTAGTGKKGNPASAASSTNNRSATTGKDISEIKSPDKSSEIEALYLTKLIEMGKLEEARNAAKVTPFLENVESYSGYFTVDKSYNSNLFFWYFPAEVEPKTAPVVLWLNGGPGFTSMYGLFYEIGPYQIVNKRIEKRDVCWSKTMHLIFIDNPVGTGFSFTENEFGFAKNESQIGENLYKGLIQFFTLFNELRNNRFYVAGESYAGKYVPAVSYAVHKNNKNSKFKINLSGLAIGNGLSDPINQLDYGNYLFNIGLIDENQKTKFENLENEIKQTINQNQTELGYDLFYNLIFGDETLFKNSTGFYNFFSFLNPTDKDDEDFANLENFLNMGTIQKSLHVNKIDFSYRNLTVRKHLKSDFLKSVNPWLSILMENYKVMLYNGQLDIIIPYLFTNNYVRKLDWCGRQNFLEASRQKWFSDGKLAGYVKNAAAADNCTCDGTQCGGSLKLVMVRNAGHTVPQDQPHWMYQLMSNFTSN